MPRLLSSIAEIIPPERGPETLNEADASASMIKPPLQRNTVRGGFASLVDVQPGICCAEACDPVNASRRTPAAIDLVVIIEPTLANFGRRTRARSHMS
jgi:hypothetical protein